MESPSAAPSGLTDRQPPDWIDWLDKMACCESTVLAVPYGLLPETDEGKFHAVSLRAAVLAMVVI
jgi:hypothetical protein